MRKDFHKLLEEDKDLKKLLGTAKEAKDNLQVQKLREELLGLLLHLVETVLVSTKSTSTKISKGTLEARLAAIMGPSIAVDKANQLTVVDSFLAEKGSKKVIK